MRKQTNLVAVLSAAALLAIGASMTSFAATPHWDMEDGEWVYLDRNGDKVIDEWKKSNGQWYHLGEDGYMEKDKLVDDGDSKYYVDPNGVRVTSRWIPMDNDDLLDDDDISTVWFYFDNKGKAVGTGKDDAQTVKTLSYGEGQKGTFMFDNEGVMLTGWQKRIKDNDKEDWYYLGEENEGWAATGWQFLSTDHDYFDDGDDAGESYDDEEWFWFGSDGKAKRNGTKQIGGKWYAFDQHGVMQNLWVSGNGSDSNVTNATGSSVSLASGSSDEKARYYGEDNGGLEKNWIWAYPTTNYDDYDDDMYWFYLDSKGRPTVATDSASKGKEITDMYNDENNKEYTLIAKSIKGKTYIFDDTGRMRNGLFELTNVGKGNSGTKLENGIYYFSDEDSATSSTDGQMVTKKKLTIEIGGEDFSFYFDSKGKAYTNRIINDLLYGENGALIDGYGDGSTYAIVEVKDIPGFEKICDKNKKSLGFKEGDRILLNGNGKIRPGGTVTDIDGMRVTVKNYRVTNVEEKK